MQTLEYLIEQNPQAILATYLVGSRAYGTSTPQSDEDYRGIFVLPSQDYLSTIEPVTQLADERNNTTYYTLKRFLQLAATAHPNIIEMLFMPNDCVVFQSPLIKPLLDNRSLFETFEHSILPEDVDQNAIDNLLREITGNWEKKYVAS